MNPPLVYVLVINWNGQEHLEECFGTLLQTEYPNVRYVLLDNASADGSVAYVREHFPAVEVIECGGNLGWSGGNNVGIKLALEQGADWIFLLNNDTATAPDALDELMACAAAHPNAGAFAPKMLMFYEPQIINSVGLECSTIGSSWDKGIGRLDTERWNWPEQVLGVCGGAMLLKAEALRKVGFLPEEFGIYLDDLDLCLRLWDAGYEIWSCPAAVVRHKFSATLGSGPGARNKYYLNTRNRLWLLLRNWPAARLLQVLPLILLGEVKALGRAVLDGAWWRVGVHLRAWIHALQYVPSAARQRKRFNKSGLKRGSYWRLLESKRLFCPGLVLPEKGWYPEVSALGTIYRPISRGAWVEMDGGRLRVAHAHCYPRLGPTQVRLMAGGQTLATLSTTSSGTTELEVPAGRLELEADRIFTAEETGELYDIGGWISVELPPIST